MNPCDGGKEKISGTEHRKVFWPAGDRTNGKVLQNLDNSNCLKTEIAYNTSIFTAVTRYHGNG